MPQAHDLIGDLHGHAGPLLRLLDRLGYHRAGGAWRHGEGRRLVFLGDYIDRGPEIPRVLRVVRELVDDGLATALMGNHEFNAIAWATPDPERPTTAWPRAGCWWPTAWRRRGRCGRIASWRWGTSGVKPCLPLPLRPRCETPDSDVR